MRQLYRLVEIVTEKFFTIERECFTIWKQIYLEWKATELEKQKNSLINKVIEVLKTSKRGKRSLVEEEILSKYLVTIGCVPKLTSAELKKLSSEVDWVDCTGRTLIFLQGDYGACFYMIAQGSIDLYLETSKDKEMVNCRRFGDSRGKSIQSEDCDELGKKITTLAEGKGFGEYAILSKTHKFRGATAVSTDERSLLLVVLEDTYNEVFRKHHFRQAQMSSAMSLLKDIPAFNWYSYSKMSQIAYNLKSQSYHGRMAIVRAGQPITNILLVHTGRIRVVDTSHHLHLKEATEEFSGPGAGVASSRSLLSKHVYSPLYVRELGRGQLIGETEVLKGLSTFELTYEASGACEVFELPREHFEEVLNASRLAVHDVEEGNELLDYRASLRLHDLSLVTQLLRSPQSPRGGVNNQTHPPFRTYKHHEAPRIPLNRPAQAKPVAVISTYDEIKDSALSRENEHNQKVERVRRMMMDMTTGSSFTSTAAAATTSQASSSSTSLSTFTSTSNFHSHSNPIYSSPSSTSILSPTKSSPKKSKKKTTSAADESFSLLEEYEMIEDLRALLPLLSGNITDSNSFSPTKMNSPRTHNGTLPSPSSTIFPSPSGYTNLPAVSSSTTQPPVVSNTYSISSLKNVTSSLTKCDGKFSANGRPLILSSPNPYSPPSNAIIEQYHRSIGRSDLLDSTSFLHPLQTPNASTPFDPHRQQSQGQQGQGQGLRQGQTGGQQREHDLNFQSPVPPPRPPRDSFENRVAFEPKTEDELIYEEEINKNKVGTVITSNPFEALGLPSTAVFRSPKEKGTGGENNFKPQPPSSPSPSKVNHSMSRRPVQVTNQIG